MRLSSLVLMAVAAAVPAMAHADEGMWLPSQMPELAAQLKAAGYQGDPTQLADLTRAPMNAVVQVGGAAGSFVSPQGLILTNHHVAYGVIQYNSTGERNLLADGFTAATRKDELPANPDFRVLVTTGFENVTDKVLADTRGKTGRAYGEAVDVASKALVAECERAGELRCSVANMYYGTDFYLVRQLELRDLRLAYAPPESVASFGGEVDNFIWPRHSGDFALLRAYVDKDGKPADYSPDNVPYRPSGHFQISSRAIKDGDYAMLAGYPAVTFRHRSASEFANMVDWQLPTRVSLYAAMIDTIEKAVAEDHKAGVMYASQLAGLRNTRKRAAGELEGLERSNAKAGRASEEAAMLEWLASNSDDGATAADIEAVEAVLTRTRTQRDHDQLFAQIRYQPQLLRAALTLQRRALEHDKPDAERESGWQQRDEPLLRGQLQQVQRRYDARVEQALLSELLRRYHALPQDQQADEIIAVFGANAADTAKRLKTLYAGTHLGDEATRLGWLDADADKLAKSDDPLLIAAAKLMPRVLADEARQKEFDGDLLRLRPAAMKAWIGWAKSQGRPTYPDANRTLRIAYGSIIGLDPRDAVHYSPITTVKGIVEKHTGEEPFNAPKVLLDAIARGNFGDTIDPQLKTQSVNFLTNLDSTGGNSGSPILDADGKLIGVHFDSNWEAVSASWKFDPHYKRGIHVDMRYMRWLMNDVYPAPQLLREMGLSKG